MTAQRRKARKTSGRRLVDTISSFVPTRTKTRARRRSLPPAEDSEKEAGWCFQEQELAVFISSIPYFSTFLIYFNDFSKKRYNEEVPQNFAPN